ncbi:hypothetical protein WR25_20383 [Diploscapter pachys]|uniref:ZP domain-containing protein n=1 Tax=Diploscapter pachys TaxID=2018661 RepID=A0A2A2J6S5_9BILA|nr:hypothetical protein WR25_20383 [Diploscapter pachys]
MKKHILKFVIFLTLRSFCYCTVDNDNELINDPILDCADNFIEVNFETKKPFLGLAFVQSHLEDPKCRSQPPDTQMQRSTGLRVYFSDCDMEKRASSSPRGLFINTTIVVAFHPDFLTKYDKVFMVQCFYMEMERKLYKKIDISMPPPMLHPKQVPMPVCRYEILDGTPTGPPVFHATVGQMVYHKWTCDSEQKDTFCMTVHSCFVDDGFGQSVQLLDEKGCALDKYLLSNLEYPSDLMAGREAHVYKYADKENMYFNCQISITIKQPGAEYCDVPICPDPPRRRRSHANDTDGVDSNETMLSEAPSTFVIPQDDIREVGWLERNFLMFGDNLCMSQWGTGILVFFNVALLSTSFILTFATIRNHLLSTKMSNFK